MSDIRSPALTTTQCLHGKAAPLAEKWGGSLPTWEEFREVAARGAVHVDKRLAEKSIGLPGVSRTTLVLYNGVLMPLALVALVALLGPPIVWWFGALSGWWILAGFVASANLVRLTRWGRSRAVFRAALSDPLVYLALIGTGIFDFDPR